MAKRMLIDAMHPEETRVVIADENQIFDFDFITTSKKQLKGNIYLAKITRVEPSLQAAFVEYGGGKQGFLPFAEIHPDYYQIPISDRKRLMEEAAGDAGRDDDTTDSATEESSEQGNTEGRAHDSVHEQDAMSAEVSVDSAPPMPSEIPANSTIEPTDTPPAPAHPAYLMQGAVDISVSEDVDGPEGDDNRPIADLLAESESSTEEPRIIPSESGFTSSETLAQNAAYGDVGKHDSDDHHVSETQSAEGVETIPSEDEEYRPKKTSFFKRYKIQEVIRRGQIVLVQVIKEERGNKGCSLTTYLSLAGRYCVLMPNSPKDGGISRKIASAEDRKRLKAISAEMRLADGMSVIIRTAGMDRTRAEIKRDYDYLVKLWNQIREDTLRSNAPALIYEESDIVKRAIRDQYTNDIDELIIEGEVGFNAAREFMKLLLPSHTPKIKHYQDATPLFYAYGIEEQLLSMHDPVVKLRSGGYLVINPTEALISIDVNSGRATGERNIEETAAKTNLEAAAEVARQLRLRDLAGLVVIDFIDMLESRNRRAVEKMMKDSLKADRAKIQLGRISPFGLMEMSRQRLRPSISESNMIQCEHCLGRGVIRSNESMSIQMIRAIEKEASLGTWSGLRLIAPQSVALHLLNTKRDILRAIEQRYDLSIQVLIGPSLVTSEFNLEKMRRAQAGARTDERDRDRDRDRDRNRPRRDRNDRDRGDRNRPRPVDASPAPALDVEPLESVDGDHIEVLETSHDDMQTTDAGSGRRNRNRRRRGGRNRNRSDRPQGTRTEGDTTEAMAEDVVGSESQEAPVTSSEANENRGRPRGNRQRRPWRDRSEGTAAAQTESYVASDPLPHDGNNLPAFATEERLPPAPPPPPAQIISMEQAPSTPSSPPKKGWWQKMIDLDD